MHRCCVVRNRVVGRTRCDCVEGGGLVEVLRGALWI